MSSEEQGVPICSQPIEDDARILPTRGVHRTLSTLPAFLEERSPAQSAAKDADRYSALN